MSEETKTEEQGTEQQTEEQAPEISNAELKNHPVFQKLASQLAEYQRKEETEKAEREKAAKEAELRKAEEEQNWQKMIDLQKAEIEQLKTSHAKDILTRDLRAELARQGFSNNMFLNGAVAGYTGDSDGIAEYVAALVADESNKPFMGSQVAQATKVSAPSTPTVTGGVLNDAKLLAMEKSSNPAERAKAREYLEALYKQGKPLPK